MAARVEQRRFVTLIGVSLLFHAAVLGFVSRLDPAPPRAPQPLELELAWVDAQPEATAPTGATEPEAAPQASPTLKKKKPTTVSGAPQPTASSSGASGGSDVPTSEGPSVGVRGDLPLPGRPSLTPSSGFAMQLDPGVAEQAPRGTTLRNGPGEAPDQRSLNEYTGEVLTRKLNTDLQQEVGLAAVAVGNVPTHFKRYESAMRTALPKAKIDVTPPRPGEALKDVAGILFNEGPSEEAAKKVSGTPLGRSIASQNVMSPNVEDQRFREGALQLMAQGENLKERITRTRLRTVLEVTTDATGALADVSIIERSGDARFDESVLHFSRKVARTIPESDDKLLGTSMWRTRWQFTWEPPDVRVRLLNAWRVAGDAVPQ